MLEGTENLTDDEIVALYRRVLGIPEETTRTILAIERGELDGDVITLDAETGEPIREPGRANP